MSRVVLAVLLVASVCGTAFSDGKMFVRGTAKVRIPDQSALICFDGKKERLVIETAFEGEGTDFAWVVPLPAIPVVEPATTGLFPTLRMITRPRLIGYDESWYIMPLMGLWMGLVLWCGILTRRWGEPLAVVLLTAVLAGLLMPALGTARSTPGIGASHSGVTIHGRKVVGAYETAIVSGKDGESILDWLNENGYGVPPAARPVLDQYTDEEWFFVAARLRRESDSDERMLAHPLSFTFDAERAVYPVRLTGVDNGPVTIDLYVAGDQEAAARHFERQRSARLDFIFTDDDEGPWYGELARRDQWVPIAHEGLRSHLGGLGAMTLLSGTLSPEDMREEVYLDWRPLKPYRQVLRMRQSAMALAANWTAGIFIALALACAIAYHKQQEGSPRAGAVLRAVVGTVAGTAGIVTGAVILGSGVLLLGVVVLIASLPILLVYGKRLSDYSRQSRERTQDHAWGRRPAGVVIALATLLPIIVGLGIYLGVDKYEGRSVRSSWRFGGADRHSSIAEDLIPSENIGAPEVALADLRRQAARSWSKMDDRGYANPFTGHSVREEDSPGNYTIELVDDRPTYFYHDANGQKALIRDLGMGDASAGVAVE